MASYEWEYDHSGCDTYFPGTTPSYSGDVFIDTAIDTSTLGAGGYGQLTITHELGHALGLKHPFEDGATLPTADDKHSNTLMSYTDYQNLIPVFTSSGSSVNVNYQQIYPDRFMVYDIAALQAIYGADTITGRPVSSRSRRSRSRSSAPPPVRIRPRSAISAPNSGGVCSRACFTAVTI